VLDDVARRDVEHPVVVRPELDADLRSCHLRAFSLVSLVTSGSS
jgi:hypothetical protein